MPLVSSPRNHCQTQCHSFHPMFASNSFIILSLRFRALIHFWVFCLFVCLNFFLIYFWRRWVFIAARGLSLVAVSGLLIVVASLVVEPAFSRCVGFSSCGSWALEHRLSSCGVWA